jgi:hypothetical protein
VPQSAKIRACMTYRLCTHPDALAVVHSEIAEGAPLWIGAWNKDEINTPFNFSRRLIFDEDISLKT